MLADAEAIVASEYNIRIIQHVMAFQALNRVVDHIIDR